MQASIPSPPPEPTSHVDKRKPKGLALVTLLMCVFNPCGYLFLLTVAPAGIAVVVAMAPSAAAPVRCAGQGHSKGRGHYGRILV